MLVTGRISRKLQLMFVGTSPGKFSVEGPFWKIPGGPAVIPQSNVPHRVPTYARATYSEAAQFVLSKHCKFGNLQEKSISAKYTLHILVWLPSCNLSFRYLKNVQSTLTFFRGYSLASSASDFRDAASGLRSILGSQLW